MQRTLQVPSVKDVKMAEIQKLNVVKLVVPVDTNFSYVGPILKVMLDKVPSANGFIAIYKKIPKIGSWHVSVDLQEIFYVNVVTRKTGACGKRKVKVDEEVNVPKTKKERKIKIKVKPSIIDEDEM
ncbi:unnamed protein product [Lactuca virosa]|uniref:DUF4283 domain-containing protein n=1 Tax=Lactuca virosa TaxID=75947 RepID=A0AAU9MKU5_9ASTR|nr:unnamed protein product [Lactuca virosa]